MVDPSAPIRRRPPAPTSSRLSRADDEGKTWKWTRHVERDAAEAQPSTFRYPSLWEAKDGTLHLSYSYSINSLPPDAARNSIKHARFNLEWIKQADQ